MVSKTVTIAIALAVVIAGVAGAIILLNPGDSGDGGETEKTSAVITDDRNRNVTVNLPVERINIPSADVFKAYVAVAGDRWDELIVGGLGNLKADDPQFYDAFVKASPGLEDTINNYSAGGLYDEGGVDVEMILKSNPEVVIWPTAGYNWGVIPDSIIDTLDAAGIASIFVDFYTDPYGEGNYERNMAILGKLLQQERRAGVIVEYYEEQMAKVTDILPTITEEAPTVLIEIMASSSAASAMGGSSAQMFTTILGASEIETARGVNAMRSLLEGLGLMNTWVDSEAVLTADPDFIYMCTNATYMDDFYTLLAYGTDPTDEELAAADASYTSDRAYWSNLTAVKEGNVHYIYAMFRSNPECFFLVQYLAQTLYPTYFEDLDVDEGIQKFYRYFMPFDLEGVWYYNPAGTA